MKQKIDRAIYQWGLELGACEDERSSSLADSIGQRLERERSLPRHEDTAPMRVFWPRAAIALGVLVVAFGMFGAYQLGRTNAVASGRSPAPGVVVVSNASAGRGSRAGGEGRENDSGEKPTHDGTPSPGNGRMPRPRGISVRVPKEGL